MWSEITDKPGPTQYREGVRLVFTLPKSPRFRDQLVYQFAETTYTDTLGYWYYDLIKSDSLEPNKYSYYAVTITDTLSNQVLISEKTFKVPDSSSWKFDIWR